MQSVWQTAGGTELFCTSSGQDGNSIGTYIHIVFERDVWVDRSHSVLHKR